MSCNVLVFKWWFPVLSFMLFFDLFHNNLSKVLLLHSFSLGFLLFFEPLTVFELSECLILFVSFFFLHGFHVFLELKLVVQCMVGKEGFLLLSFKMLIMRFEECLSTIIIFLNMIKFLKCLFFIVVNISLTVFAEMRCGHVGSVHHRWSFLLHSDLVKETILFSQESLFVPLFLLKVDSLLELILEQTFVSLLIIETGISINLDSINETGINLGPENLFVMFWSLEYDPIWLSLIGHVVFLF